MADALSRPDIGIWRTRARAPLPGTVIAPLADIPEGSEVVAGQWWSSDYHGPPLISFDASLARGMGLKIGDTLTVNVLGREVTAKIANLRSIDWTRLGINFAIVFAPGTLEAAPTHQGDS